MPGQINEHILAPIPGRWSRASVRGELKTHGWGAQQGFPALSLTSQTVLIEGYVLESAALKQWWSTLDAFEGEENEKALPPPIGQTALRLEPDTQGEKKMEITFWSRA